MVSNLQIFIGMIGVLDQENLGYQIHQRHCSVALYQDERIKLKYSGKNPDEV
ncbi:20269_t:CDS:2 [Rhizophagus irregularis]|nr:20269_t:CDS:2 [Rhizophagus irregularis]